MRAGQVDNDDDRGLRIERRGAVALFVIERPHARNSLTLDGHRELIRQWGAAQQDPEIRAVVITGAEDRDSPVEKQSFCAGADVQELFDGTAAGSSIPSVASVRGRTPAIAAVNGYCIGSGLGFAFAADLRLASPTATFGLPEVPLGNIPANGAIRQAMLEMPRAIVVEMLLLPGRMSATRALELGFLNRIVPHEELLTTALEWAEIIAALPIEAVDAAMLLATAAPGADPNAAAVLEGALLDRLNQAMSDTAGS